MCINKKLRNLKGELYVRLWRKRHKNARRH